MKSLAVRVGIMVVAILALGLTGCGGSDGSTAGDAADAAEVQGDVPAADAADAPAPEDLGPDVPDEDNVPPEDSFVPDELTDTPAPNECNPACSFQAGEYCDETDWQCRKVECQVCYKDVQCGETGSCLDFTYPGDDKVGICSTDCTQDAECPAGFSCNVDAGDCVPLAACKGAACGQGEAGDPCSYEGAVNAACGTCKEGLSCVGFKPQPSMACEFDKDCVKDNGVPMAQNPDCVKGRCGGSFCAPPCDENGACPQGFVASSSGFSCYCLAVDIGTAKAGEACQFSQVNFESDSCEEELTCLGIVPTEDSLMCDEDSSCALSSYPGGPDCIDGLCATSFCSPKCDDTGECEEDWVAIDVSGICYCLPMATGDGKKGDACPFGNVNSDGKNCADDFACVGMPVYDWSPECEAPEDCPQSFVGEVDCFLGHCGSSVCTAECDQDGKCPAGFDAWVFGGGFCYCVPGEGAGASKQGEACPAFNVNPDADTCASGLACFSIVAVQDPAQTCVVPSDCNPDENPGVIDCVDGYCGASFCAPMCDADGMCPVGYIPFGGEEEKSACYCLALPIGETAEGLPCPFDTVHATADYCQAGLACLGIPADEFSALCTTDEDCGEDAYLGNGVCIDGTCGTSICSAPCDEDGLCGEGQEPLKTDLGCYCLPDYTGAAEEGDACPMGNIALDLDYCLPELDCIGLSATNDTAECTKDADCPAEYPGAEACFMGHCGSSICATRCDDGSKCPAGTGPQFIGGRCHCLEGDDSADSVPGEACQFVYVNDLAASCNTGLACVGNLPIGSDECEKPADCAAEDYVGGIECIDGLCASSFCAAACDADGKCADGFEPIAGGQDCYCSPVPAI